MKSLRTLFLFAVVPVALAQPCGCCYDLYAFSDRDTMGAVLFEDCGSTPVPDGRLIRVFYDVNRNGPDDADSVAVLCGPGWLPPECVSWNTSRVNGESLLGVPGTFVPENWLLTGNREECLSYYLVVYCEDEVTLNLVSDTFQVQQAHWPLEVLLDEWTCVNPCSQTSDEPRAAMPSEFVLCPNFPNPFNLTTTIRYDVKTTGLVSLKVFDLLGRDVATLIHGTIPAGSYSMEWNAGDLPSGVYLCRMEAPDFVQTRKMVLLK